jgi:hypothetical protein
MTPADPFRRNGRLQKPREPFPGVFVARQRNERRGAYSFRAITAAVTTA